MMRNIGYILSIVAVWFLAVSLPGAAQQSKVFLADVDGEISAGTVRYIERSITRAEDASAEMLIITLHTPGGLFKATEEISRALLDSNVPVAVFVEKPGGWAFSAGTYILLSSDIAVSHPDASIGAAQPVEFSGEPGGEKIEAAARSWITTLAQRTERDIDTAERFVTENLTLTGSEALAVGMIDLTAEDISDLVRQLDMTEAQIVPLEPSFLDHVFSFLALPYLVPIFLSLGALALFLAFRTGEFDVLGGFGAVFLLLGLWGIGAINLSALGTVLLVVGLSLVLFEFLATPGDFGISGIIGSVALFFGITAFANEPFFPTFLGEPLFWLLVGLFTGFAAFFILIGQMSFTALRTPVQTGSEALVGKEAIAITELHPMGTVELEGEPWTARLSDENGILAPGRKITVVKVIGNTIIGEPVNDRE